MTQRIAMMVRPTDQLQKIMTERKGQRNFRVTNPTGGNAVGQHKTTGETL
jgi:hypothetical protein